MNRSAIEWTERTWNPLFGCTQISPGCDNCYAKRLATRWGKDFSKVEIKPQKLAEPLQIKEPSMVFVPSMSDLFHREVPDYFVYEVFKIMAHAPQHTFQDLTKRPLRMLNFQQKYFPEGFPDNVWVGVSVENHDFVGRIDILRKVKAKRRFVSYEPSLGSILPVNLSGIDWLISGGESDYHHPRLADPEWFREIRDECKRQGVAYFHKQNGGSKKCECHKAWGCRLLDGRTWDEMPN